MKRVISSKKKINPFGGINFIIDALRKKGVASLIDKTLGARPKQATYSYSDIILFWIYCNLCGGTRLEDSHHFKRCLAGTPDLQMPSPDAIGRVFKSLATENTLVKARSGGEHAFNNNEALHELLMKVIVQFGLLDKTKGHTLDYDNTIIEAEKYDVKKSYAMVNGYQPGVSFINKIPVHVHGRNGNAAAHICMDDTLNKVLSRLNQHGVIINRFRSDSAAYQKNVVELMEDNNINFFIKGKAHKTLSGQAANITDWEEYRYNGQKRYLSSMTYKPFAGEKKYRYVVVRTDSINSECRYFWIITNDWKMTNHEILEFYNQRGAIERNFDALKNDFNWGRLPFSFMNENTVFLLLSALAYVIYLYSLKKFSKKVNFVKKNFRLKNFIFHFITVGVFWINNDELRIYTTNRYEILLE